MFDQKYNCIFINFQKLYEEFFQIMRSSCIALDREHPNQMSARAYGKKIFE